MSTEARRASLPPHPGTPPRPQTPPRPATPPSPESAPPRPESVPGASPTPDPGTGHRPPSPHSEPPARPASPPRPESVPPGVPPRPAQAPAAERGGDARSGARRDTAASTPGGPTTAGDGRADSGARTRYPRFRLGEPRSAGAAPPPRASARFPDSAPTVGRGDAPSAPGAPQAPPRRPGAPAQTPTETTARLRPVPAETEPEPRPEPAVRPAPAPPSGPADRPAAPNPAFSWSGPVDTRPRVSFGEPEGYDALARPRPLGGRPRPQAVAAAVCLVLGVGLLTGAVTGSWLAGDSGDDGARSAFTEAGDLWHSVPVDQLFPPTVQGKGAGPGGADRTWTRVAVAPDGDCAGAFDRLLAKVLDPVGCSRLLRATYTDATQSHVTTVGLLFTKADAAAMTALASRFEKEGLGRREDLMPLPYAAKDTVAAGFGAPQRASWTVSVLTDAPVVVYAVSGWADGRTVDEPEPAEEAVESGATSAPAQAGLGHEAQGLADRVERALRKHVGAPTEHPS
ncbi:hypothetical protein [Streptomyces sp. x-45]|uniref:hypothetical protein n=1 Tax=Streptomyces sp. x-45 TaxID=2789281 RepID=UPI00397EAD60